MNKVGILSLSNALSDSRPKRAIGLLQEKRLNYFIFKLNLKVNRSTLSRIIKASKLGICLVLFYLNLNRDKQARNFISHLYNIEDFDRKQIYQAKLLMVFDLDLLVFLTNLPRETRVILDLRELYPEQYVGSFVFKAGLRKIRIYILKSLVSNICTELTSVSQGMQNYYLERFNLHSTVLRSVPDFQILKSSHGCSPKPQVVYMGIANPVRRLEKAIEIFCKLRDKYDFHLYLVGDPDYIRHIKAKYHKFENIFFEKPVPQEKIQSTLSKFDIGWTFYEPTTANFEVALPNKFFDYMQAGLAVLGAPTRDMIQQTSQFNFGIFPNQATFSSAHEFVAKLTADEIIYAKSEARNASKIVNFQSESVILNEVIERLLDE
jgi:glycosyltransferase involved in cell wall biosynthesis